jgi:hypothetical protein
VSGDDQLLVPQGQLAGTPPGFVVALAAGVVAEPPRSARTRSGRERAPAPLASPAPLVRP